MSTPSTTWTPSTARRWDRLIRTAIRTASSTFSNSNRINSNSKRGVTPQPGRSQQQEQQQVWLAQALAILPRPPLRYSDRQRLLQAGISFLDCIPTRLPPQWTLRAPCPTRRPVAVNNSRTHSWHSSQRQHRLTRFILHRQRLSDIIRCRTTVVVVQVLRTALIRWPDKCR